MKNSQVQAEIETKRPTKKNQSWSQIEVTYKKKSKGESSNRGNLQKENSNVLD